MSGPRVLVVGTRYHGLTAVESALAVGEAWQAAAPAAVVVSLAAADGGPGFLDAIERTLGGTRHSAAVGGSAATFVLQDGADPGAYVDAAEVVSLAGAEDTSPVGELVGALIDQGHRRIVVGIGGLRTLDGGAGFLRGLAGRSGADGEADPAATIAGARARAHGVQLTGVADQDRSLLGFQGAAAAAQATLGLTIAQSQEAEAQMGRWVDQVRSVIPTRRDLMTGKALQDDRVPGAGAGGGLGYGLLVAGGAVVTGPAWWAAQAHLDEQAGAADLVVIVQEVYDWQVLDASVLSTTADSAARAARPAIVIADEVQVGRRETMTSGLAGTYAVTDAPMLRDSPPDPATARAQLAALATRLAGTWTPQRPGDVL